MIAAIASLGRKVMKFGHACSTPGVKLTLFTPGNCLPFKGQQLGAWAQIAGGHSTQQIFIFLKLPPRTERTEVRKLNGKKSRKKEAFYRNESSETKLQPKFQTSDGLLSRHAL